MMDSRHFLKVLSSASRSNEQSGVRCWRRADKSGIQVERIPAWSDPMEAGQSMVGRVMTVSASMAMLWKVRSRVLLRLPSRPLCYVSTNVCLA